MFWQFYLDKSNASVFIDTHFHKQKAYKQIEAENIQYIKYILSKPLVWGEP